MMGRQPDRACNSPTVSAGTRRLSCHGLKERRVCARPTVYNFAYIGNERPAVVFDVLARVLAPHVRRVVYARNFTDVDDKINAIAISKRASHLDQTILPVGRK